MYFIAHLSRARLTTAKSLKTPLAMKLLLTTVFVLFLTMYGLSQSVSLSLADAPIEEVFREIKKQTGYNFVYTRDQLERTTPVTIKVTNVSLTQALDACFKGQALSYRIEDKYIVVREKPKTNPLVENNGINVSGKVLDDKGIPIGGATVGTKGSARIVVTDDQGDFFLPAVERGSMIVVSHVGYQEQLVKVNSDAKLIIELSYTVHNLDETMVIAYGTTTKRLSTGSVEKVSKEDIQKQPVSNVLAALHGRVTGLTVVQQNGVPGSAVKIQIRGRTSINSAINNDPLIIIDGVPFAPNNTSINQVGSALGNGGLSPFSSINPADIESIEVLKDADATSIYGSRGANGVILITTKRGKAGKTKVDVSFRTGFSEITRMMPFMSTKEYVTMRKEAFSNDGIIPNTTVGSPGYAPDLTIWDTTGYTDLKELLIGGTAQMTEMQIRLSGGTETTQFSLGSGYSKQTTVFPGNLYNDKVSFHFSLNHRSSNNKFSMALKGSYVYDNNNINASDLTASLRLPPNIPSLYSAEGKLNWQMGGVSFENPLAYVLRSYQVKTRNLLASTQFNYQFTKSFSFRSNIGFNAVNVDDRSTNPIMAQNPATAPLGSASFGSNDFSSLIAEPQLEYKKRFGKLRCETLLGSTWQRSSKQGLYLLGNGYTNDALINSLRGAATITVVRNDEIIYKYAAVFGRLNLNWNDRYIANLTARRDGSSRFGPDKQYSSFSSAGFAWLFSKEPFVKKHIPVLSFGKLRTSYGLTGNDKIGDYAYLNTYSSTGLSYQGTPAISPNTLFNPDYAWELNKKFETALELGFFKDRLQLTTTYFYNESGNQLINYSLPAQTGAQSIIANFPASVINRGWEIELTGTPVFRKNIEWNLSANISFPRNKLTAFPGIENTSYNALLVIGEPLNIAGGYRFAGVNPQTGLFEFFDKDAKRTSSPVLADRVKNLVSLDPEFYGGLSSALKYKKWELDLFVEFRKQQGQTYLGNIYSGLSFPGMMFNVPSALLARWQSPGDQAMIQRFTRGAGTPAYLAAGVIANSGSDIRYGDASYVRLKNVSLSYTTSLGLHKKTIIETLRIFLQAQNLLTITSYLGADPETQNLFTLPTLKTIAGGVQLTF